MKRSEVNRAIDRAKRLFTEYRFALPPWAIWSPKDWKGRYDDCREIVDCMLGWDVTTFGGGDFSHRGLTAFTLRNGRPDSPQDSPPDSPPDSAPGPPGKPYGEKILVVEEEQETPMHFHASKMEDIINRGGGNLVIQFFGSAPDGTLSDKTVRLSLDGVTRIVGPGERVVLTPGESVCIVPGVYHRFFGEPGAGTVLVGEVSSVNDDTSDNYWYDDLGRFSDIEEDEPPLHLLAVDYHDYL